jgi:hypothetical protein
MACLIHFADLHISVKDADYSFSVLDELIGAAAAKGAQALLCAGDLFDSLRDLDALRVRFRERLEALPPGCRFLYLPGNHDSDRKGASALAGYDLGRAELLAGEPFARVELPGFEVIALPWGPAQPDYRSWELPPPGAAPRIVAAHGMVPCLSFAGPDEEGGGSIDADFFRWARASYGALGHVHAGRSGDYKGVKLAYPGSARVWRADESGPRRAVVLRAEGGLHAEWLALASAGQYREVACQAMPDGSVQPDRAALDGAGPLDHLRLVASGLVEDEAAFRRGLEALAEGLAKAHRRVEADSSAILVFEGARESLLVKRFEALWEARRAKGGDDPAALAMARVMALSEFKHLLEAKR